MRPPTFFLLRLLPPRDRRPLPTRPRRSAIPYRSVAPALVDFAALVVVLVVGVVVLPVPSEGAPAFAFSLPAARGGGGAASAVDPIGEGSVRRRLEDDGLSFLRLCRDDGRRPSAAAPTSGASSRTFAAATALFASPSTIITTDEDGKEKEASFGRSLDFGSDDDGGEASLSPSSSPASQSSWTCRSCGAGPFPSRNALFRHIRSCVECAADGGGTAKSASRRKKKKKRKVAVLFGYYRSGRTAEAKMEEEAEGGDRSGSAVPHFLSSSSPPPTTTATNELAGKIVERAFLEARRRILLPPGDASRKDDGKADDDVTTALASEAVLRHPSLGQEKECDYASADVLSIDYFANPDIEKALVDDEVLDQMRAVLSEGEGEDEGEGEGEAGTRDNNDGLDVHLLGLTSLPPSTKFHAERSCTQRTYRYVLPLRWLEDGGKEVERWWLRNNMDPSENNQEGGGGGHRPRGEGGGPPEALRRLKRALKLAESGGGEDKHTTTMTSPGRFGSLGRKVRVPFHNFADPNLRPPGSPAHPSAWRAVDRCRVSTLISDRHGRGVSALIEVRGDSFLSGQVRRIVGSALAIANGWVSPSFFETALRPDVIFSDNFDGGPMEVPAAPVGRMYAAWPRFHFVEMGRGAGRGGLFDADGKNDGSCNEEEGWIREVHSRMLQDLDSDIVRTEEDHWLARAKDVVSPRIRARLQEIAAEDEEEEDARRRRSTGAKKARDRSDDGRAKDPGGCSEAPQAYRKVLAMLQNIVREGSWPPTTGTRSKFLRSPVDGLSSLRLDTGAGVVSSTFPGDSVSSGSFTVVNQKAGDVSGASSAGNKLFPDLARAAFELEEELIRDLGSLGQREPSTHCAVNRNVEYVPHVDGGRGQLRRDGAPSSSLLVGLGDYSGGKLVVEEDCGGGGDATSRAYDVRYRPVDFDGWTRTHWTEPFEGERYTLVFFTPERAGTAGNRTEMLDDDVAKEDNGQGQRPETAKTMREEDFLAKAIAAEHASSSSGLLPVNLRPLSFRRGSTDALAIREILDPDRCAYELPPSSSSRSASSCSGVGWEDGFSVEGHSTVLDVGAHIGVFARYALGKGGGGGARRVICYEPEPDNLNILRENLAPFSSSPLPRSTDDGSEDDEEFSSGMPATVPVVEIHAAAVSQTAESGGGWDDLVLARGRNDGTANTWRHSLQRHASYVDRAESSLPSSSSQEGTLVRRRVRTVPFFGGALVPGATFVKMDCEGAEMDVLLSEEAADAERWLDVTHLVAEWSFTKERRVKAFRRAVRNLESAGFRVRYEGRGAWWDTDSNVLWPFHTDLCVFARRD